MKYLPLNTVVLLMCVCGRGRKANV